MDIFFRFVMVVRKNVLEYIIALVVAKNKVRLKKCLKKFQIWQSSIVRINLSIFFFKINTKISTSFRQSMLISFWIDVPGADPGGAHGACPPKIGKNMIFWREIVIFLTKYPKNVRASVRSAQFFLSTPEFIIYQFIINDTILYPLGGEIWNKNTGPDFKQKQ